MTPAQHQSAPIWNCVYISGDGTEYKEGMFREAARTDKVLTLEMIDEGFYANYPEQKVRKIPTPDGKPSPFCPVVDWDENSVTVYHNQVGTPYIYTRSNS